MTFKVAYLRSTAPMLITGAEISMFERLKYLKNEYKVIPFMYGFAASYESAEMKSLISKRASKIEISDQTIMATLEELDSTTFIRPKVDLQTIAKSLDPLLDENKIDLIFVNARDSLIIEYALTQTIPVVYFLSEDFFLRPDQLDNDDKVTSKVFSRQSNLVVPSRFLASRVKQAWQMEPRVLNDVVFPKLAKAGMLNPKKYVSMLHPYQHKGIEIVIELAQLLPQIPFLVTAGYGESFNKFKPFLSAIPNIELRSFSPDISGILKESILVLVPSLCRDVFPRIILEALSAGVPVIASDIGGCREAGGQAARYVPVKISEEQSLGTYDLLDWVKSMKEILSGTTYPELSQKALSYYQSYRENLASSMTEFEGWCREIIAKK